MCRLDTEADRLLCDDGPTLLWRPTAGKASRDRRVTGWAANGQHAGSRIRQEYCEASSIQPSVDFHTTSRDSLWFHT